MYIDQGLSKNQGSPFSIPEEYCPSLAMLDQISHDWPSGRLISDIMGDQKTYPDGSNTGIKKKKSRIMIMSTTKWLSRLNPALPKKWLLILAGVMWSGVGVMLLRYAIIWLTHPLSTTSVLLGSLGAMISIAVNRMMFSVLAGKNIERILSFKDKACVFSFQAWKGYMIIPIMITAGLLMRNSAFPKPYLAVVYATIGGALLQASMSYYLRFSQLLLAGRIPSRKSL